MKRPKIKLSFGNGLLARRQTGVFNCSFCFLFPIQELNLEQSSRCHWVVFYPSTVSLEAGLPSSTSSVRSESFGVCSSSSTSARTRKPTLRSRRMKRNISLVLFGDLLVLRLVTNLIKKIKSRKDLLQSKICNYTKPCKWAKWILSFVALNQTNTLHIVKLSPCLLLINTKPHIRLSVHKCTFDKRCWHADKTTNMSKGKIFINW